MVFCLRTDALLVLLNMSGFHNAICVLNYQFCFQAKSTATRLFFLPYVQNFKDFSKLWFGPMLFYWEQAQTEFVEHKGNEITESVTLICFLECAIQTRHKNANLKINSSYTVEALCIFSISFVETRLEWATKKKKKKHR